MKVTLITVGTLKNREIRELCDEYVKRLGPLLDFRMIEVKPEPFYSEKDHDLAKKREWERIEHSLAKLTSDVVYLMAEDGFQTPSVDFASKALLPYAHVVFIVGGALGWPHDLSVSYRRISLSKMTFPHEIARLVLIEQIYRAAMINSNKRYNY